MLYIILSDIHSNLQALEAVIESFPQKDNIAVICVGDIVGYGANPMQCLDIIRRLNARCVLGNHDAAVVNRMDISRLNEHALDAIIWTKAHTNRIDMRYFDYLPYTFTNDLFTMVHGTLNDPEEFNYLTTNPDAEKTFKLLKTRICFVGHTHRPGVFMERAGIVHPLFRKKFTIEDDAKYIINVGSVGQPRDYDNRASYCTYSPENNEIEFRRIEYDIKSAKKAISDAGLPKMLGDRLLIGQ
ncbi:MAG: metallophosphatase family protein [Candidatus Omnitrophica bacterium]|nr:metallophosphatase family protein [Candidatus Omnitrophota bacterium]